jgi:catechol 2,3-dioxygenase-like lactoylglutathione lyase family enzyme
MMPDPLEALRLPLIPVEPRPEFTASLLRRLSGEQVPARGATVRYFVADLDAAVAFYRDDLGFDEELRPAPTFAMLYRGDLRLLLSVPGAAHALPDGTLPDPGGWNRIVLQVPDLAAAVDALHARGVRFRHEIVTSVGVRQTLLEDPSGNPVELFEPIAGYHERASRTAGSSRHQTSAPSHERTTDVYREHPLHRPRCRRRHRLLHHLPAVRAADASE